MGWVVHVGLWVAGDSGSVVQPMMARSADVRSFLGPLLLYLLVGTLIAPTGEMSLHKFINSILTLLITFNFYAHNEDIHWGGGSMRPKLVPDFHYIWCRGPPIILI